MARCARASSMRSIAVRRSRFELAARSINEVSIESSKALHQARKSADRSVTSLIGIALCEADCRSCATGGAVARADQCGGTPGVGRTKLGPTVQAASRITMRLEAGARAILRELFMAIIACGG